MAAPSALGKVLVIDDDESLRELIALHLRNDGYDVLQAEDAVAAAHLIVQSPPDLVIVDVQMPYMNGYDFVHALQSDPATSRIPVLFLTSDEQVANQSGRFAADYLTKPVRADRLLNLVRQYTRR